MKMKKNLVFPNGLYKLLMCTVYRIQYEILNIEVPNGILLMYIFQKRNLFMLYGKNPASNKKIAVVEHLRKRRDFHSIAREMQVTLATAQAAQAHC